jgi:hypothetical protein
MNQQGKTYGGIPVQEIPTQAHPQPDSNLPMDDYMKVSFTGAVLATTLAPLDDLSRTMTHTLEVFLQTADPKIVTVKFRLNEDQTPLDDLSQIFARGNNVSISGAAPMPGLECPPDVLTAVSVESDIAAQVNREKEYPCMGPANRYEIV